MKRWRCRACGRVFEGEPPKKHGVFIVRLLMPAIDEMCNGTLEEIPDNWEKNIQRMETP